MMSDDDDARRPVWSNGSDMWSPISEDIRVGDWLDFIYLDRHCHAMIRSISTDDVKVGMVSDDTREVVLPCLTIGIAQDGGSRVRNVTAWRYYGIMRCGRGLYRTQGNTYIWNDGSEEHPWEILESSYGPMNDQGLMSILSDSDFPVVSVLPVDLTDEV